MSSPAPGQAAISVVLVAAGRGRRMGGDVPKAWLPLGGVPILLRTTQRLARILPGAEIVIAVSPDDHVHMAPLAERLTLAGATRFVDGGESRQASVLAGVRGCGGELVLVHDAVRPFFPRAATLETVRLARELGAAVLAVNARDTLKEVGVDGHVLRTLPRESVWQAQTPQTFRSDILLEALVRAGAEGFSGTDDASLVEHAGHPVFVVPGSPWNLKITTREDLWLAERILAAMETEDS
jgi:2-C-methyl-D-erythritol 4-phosphate cytidylyltransferase